MKILRIIIKAIIAIPVLILALLAMPFALLAGVFQGRTERQLRKRFLAKYGGKKIGILAYNDSRKGVATIINNLEADLAKELIIVKAGQDVDLFCKDMVDHYRPNFEAASPLDDLTPDSARPYSDIHIIVIHPKKGHAYDLLYHDEKLTSERTEKVSSLLNDCVLVAVDKWRKAS
ncbi:MAG: hypothetical protein ABWY71_01135 [Candidatus Saccharimonadales bacterium]